MGNVHDEADPALWDRAMAYLASRPRLPPEAPGLDPDLPVYYLSPTVDTTRCIWCEGTGFVGPARLTCRTCGGAGFKEPTR